MHIDDQKVANIAQSIALLIQVLGEFASHLQRATPPAPAAPPPPAAPVVWPGE